MKHKKNLFLCLIAILAIFSIVSCGGNELPNVPGGDTAPVKEKLAVPDINYDFDTEAERINAEAGKVVKFFTKTLADGSHPDVYFTTDPAIGENVTIETGTKQDFKNGTKLPNAKEVTYWAFSYKEGYESSDVVSFSFTINNKVLAFSDADNTNALTNANSGTYGQDVSVYLSTSRTEEGTIWYTLDGSDPTAAEGTRKAYADAIPITAPEDHPEEPNLNKEVTITLKAYFDDGTQAGKIETFEFIWTNEANNFLITRAYIGGNSARIVEITNVSGKDLSIDNLVFAEKGKEDTSNVTFKGILPANKSILIKDPNGGYTSTASKPASDGVIAWINEHDEYSKDATSDKIWTNGIHVNSSAAFTPTRSWVLKDNGKVIDALNTPAKYSHYIRHYDAKPSIGNTWSVVVANDVQYYTEDLVRLMTYVYGENQPVEFCRSGNPLELKDNTVTFELGKSNKIAWVSSTKVTDLDGNLINTIEFTEPGSKKVIVDGKTEITITATEATPAPAPTV